MKRKLTCTFVILAIGLLTLLVVSCGGPQIVSLENMELTLYPKGNSVRAIFETYTTEVEMVLPNSILSENLTGTLSYLYTSDCEKVTMEAEGIGINFMCKSGEDIGQEDIAFTEEDYHKSLEAAGYDCSDIRYESYVPSERALAYTLVFAAGTGTESRIYCYANAVDLDARTMYTIIMYQDAPAEEDQKLLENILPFASFSTQSTEAVAAKAQEGDAGAQFYMGLCCYAGNHVEQSDKDAYFWMEQAAEGGYRPARLYQGCFLFYGIGTTADQEEGLSVLEELVHDGYEPAKTWLDVLGSAQ